MAPLKFVGFIFLVWGHSSHCKTSHVMLARPLLKQTIHEQNFFLKDKESEGKPSSQEIRIRIPKPLRTNMLTQPQRGRLSLNITGLQRQDINTEDKISSIKCRTAPSLDIVKSWASGCMGFMGEFWMVTCCDYLPFGSQSPQWMLLSYDQWGCVSFI